MAYLSVFSGGLWADELGPKQQQEAQDTEEKKQQQAGCEYVSGSISVPWLEGREQSNAGLGM